MSRKEKHLFKKYISKSGLAQGNEISNYVTLFDYLASGKSIEENDLLKGTGLTRKELLTASRHLRKVIFESLVYFEENLISGLHVGKKAIEKGFIRYGKSTLLSELESSIKKQSPEYLNMLLGEIISLDRFYGWGLSLDDLSPDLSSFPKDYLEFVQAKYFIQSIRKSLKSNPSEWKTIEQQIREKTTDWNDFPQLVPFKIERLRLSVLLNILVFKNREALETQKELVSIIQNNPNILKAEDIILEYRMLLSFQMDQGHNEDALDILTYLSSLEVPSHLEGKMVETWTVNSLVLSASTCDLELGKRAIKDLERNESSLESRWKFLAFHSASILSIYSENWNEGIHWQNKVGRLARKDRRGREWMAPLVKSLCLFENGYLGEAKKLLNRPAISNNPYARFAGSIFLSFYSNSIQGNNSELVLKRELEAYQTIIEGNDFGIDYHYFDLKVWILSKLKNVPMSSLVKESGISLFSISKAS